MAIDTRTFSTYIDKYQDLVYHICLSFTRNYFDAQDLAQETFLSAFRRIDTFDGENFKAWISVIAANKCKDYLTNPRRKIVPVEREELDLLASDKSPPEETVINRLAAGHVQALCQALDEPYRSVALAYFCYDRKLSELAKESGIRLRTLQTRLYRAKKKLAALWEEESKHENLGF